MWIKIKKLLLLGFESSFLKKERVMIASVEDIRIFRLSAISHSSDTQTRGPVSFMNY